MPSTASWWGSKVRQFRSHVRARVAPDERAALAGWVTPEQLALFDSMHIADRRHGLDVVATLRSQDVSDEDVLLAGLLHDAGKGRTGVWPRVAYSLGQVYGAWIWRVAGILPPMRTAIDRLRAHADASARLAERAGASPRTVDLIRHQEAPVDPDAGRLLQLADEAN
jgi:HD domain